jgi:hypothetical protein
MACEGGSTFAPSFSSMSMGASSTVLSANDDSSSFPLVVLSVVDVLVVTAALPIIVNKIKINSLKVTFYTPPLGNSKLKW